MRPILFLMLAWSLVSCSAPERKNSYSSGDSSRPVVDEKYSLTADRQKLDQMRAEVPPERKKENDELALILQLTGEVKKEPSDIRSKFDSLIRKKRELFDKDMKKEREVFTKKEKKERDDFLKDQAQRRENFNRQKFSKEVRDTFYKESEARRLEYFANERERRSDFESDMRDKRKNFEDYIKEKNNEFNQEYRSYSRRFEEMKRKKKEASKESNQLREVKPFNPMDPQVGDLDREIEEIKQRPGSQLGTGE